MKLYHQSVYVKILTTIVLILFIVTLACAEKRKKKARGLKAFGLGGIDARVPVQWIDAHSKRTSSFTYGPGEYGRKLKHAGKDRFYEIHVPSSYDKSKPTPVVLVFHGGAGYPSAVRYQSGMDSVSDKNGFIVVYPAGTGKLFNDRLLIWNDGRRYKDGSAPGANDVGFIALLIDDLAGLFNIDRKRIYACGISNGAQFSYRLAKQLSDRIAAIAVIAGQRSAKDAYFSAPTKPMPIMQFSGKKDIYAPYNGGEPHKGTKFFKVKFETKLDPVEEVIRSWVEFNKCPPKPARMKKVGNAVMKQYGPGSDGAEVVLWTLEDGGHTWPGGKVFPSEIKTGVGHINTDIFASELMWRFFKKFTRQ
jgi:polyhydroxybutyrate depolymerase